VPHALPQRAAVDSQAVGPLSTEAIILRSIRYGEADRILHLYSSDRGRLGAIAKGARKTTSRFGGRLEPFVRVRIDLHQGRSELLTVTGVAVVATNAHLRREARALDFAARACDAVGRVFETEQAHPAVFNLLCNALALLHEQPCGATLERALSFRLKLLLAAGLAPRLGACANCSAREGLVQFSGAAGGVLCSRCAARGGVEGFALSRSALEFMVGALARPLAQAPQAPGRALAQAERAIGAILAHHAHVRLLPALGEQAAERAGRVAAVEVLG
jgi:DNA repair protein RecO (recombination protein O)